ncbi:hypothetical protein [Sulfitobacter sp. THAF37]|uniref:hypothetical protein n=1 Tax=Sulfitobacter sp. THAF37 TaxID=2587855 RepID=UPI001561C8C4|nr:hypothetical protein [Sulfitobacter sp. THAF37]
MATRFSPSNISFGVPIFTILPPFWSGRPMRIGPAPQALTVQPPDPQAKHQLSSSVGGAGSGRIAQFPGNITDFTSKLYFMLHCSDATMKHELQQVFAGDIASQPKALLSSGWLTSPIFRP